MLSRRDFISAAGGSLLSTAIFPSAFKQSHSFAAAAEETFKSTNLTAANEFTGGIEGPACDASGNLYAVNYKSNGTIGKVAPDGKCSKFVDLPNDSIGNGIRFDSDGNMLIADYVNHNILKVDMTTKKVSVFAHNDQMNQPNDLSITVGNVIYASDPNWSENNGQIWRITPDGKTTRLATGVGTTNGIEVAPDERTLYVGESKQLKVWAYTIDGNGGIGNKRLFIEFPDNSLDGMRCDIVGNLYVTRYKKGTIAKVSPSGKILREITLLGKKPSNICFGGTDGKTCYVTVADTKRVETFRADQEGRSFNLFQSGIREPGIASSSLPRLQLHQRGSGGHVFIRFNAPTPGRIALSVFDVQGKRIQTFTMNSNQSGPVSCEWNGRDHTNRNVAAGRYALVAVLPNGQQITRRFELR